MASDYNVVHRAKNVEAGPFSGPSYGPSLTASSPAVDAADTALCPALDYRGLPRPVDGDGDGQALCDAGAYEWRPFSSSLYLPLVIRSGGQKEAR